MLPKRILILTNRVPYPLNDGGNLAMKAMIDGYHAEGWEVFLLSMNTSRHYIAAPVLNTIYRNIAAFETVDIDNTVRLWPLLTNFLLGTEPEHAQRFRSRLFSNKLVATLEEFQPGIVQVESIYLSVYLPVIRKNSSAKIILRLHNIEYQVWDRLAAQTKNPLKKYYLRNLAGRIRLFEERVWREYDRLLPITAIDGMVVQEKCGNALIHIVPFGIDTSIQDQPLKEEQWVGYHIGAMDWLPNREGIDWFTRQVYPRVAALVPGFTFFFAGRNMPEDYKALNIPGIICEGEVPDAREFIADKKILIVPIRSGGGIRVKILEAMAAGKVVVSTTIGMQGIEAINGLHFVLADTPGDFAQAVSWIMHHKAEASKIGENARALIFERYDSRNITKELSGVVRKLLSK